MRAARLALLAATLSLLLPALAAAEGFKIVFLSTRNGDSGIFVMNGDGSGVKRLTDDKLAILLDGAWSPDGRRLLFSAMRKTGLQLGPRGLIWPAGDEQMLEKYALPFHFPLYLMDAGGSGQKRLLDVPVVPGARWSPDGKRILFTSAYEDPDRNDPAVRRGASVPSSALYVLDTTTWEPKRITGIGETDLMAFASWSPDGAHVVYTCGHPPKEPREICVVGADGTQRQQLTKRGGTAVGAAWSPDGRRIAFVAAPHGPWDHEGGVYVVDAGGANQRRISKLLTSSVAWSPDGKSLLVRSTSGVFVVNVDGNYGTKLDLGAGRVLDVVFSPDGRAVLYRSNDGGKQQIYAVDVDGSNRRKISDGAGSDSTFAVSH